MAMVASAAVAGGVIMANDVHNMADKMLRPINEQPVIVQTVTQKQM